MEEERCGRKRCRRKRENRGRGMWEEERKWRKRNVERRGM